MDLDNLAAFAALDSADLLQQIDAMPDLLEQHWEIAARYLLPDWQDLRYILVAGVDEAGIAAEMLQVYLSGLCQIPVIVWRDYGLPRWASGPQTLVIAVSHTGDSQEVSHAFAQAAQQGCRRLAICSGGPLALQPVLDPVWRYEHPGPASQALACQFALLLRVVCRLGLIPLAQAGLDLAQAAAAMRQQQAGLRAQVPVVNNLAKRMAGQFVDRYAVVFAADVLAPVARRWKTQINRLAQAWVQFEILPEANHNTLAGTLRPADLERMLALFLTASEDHPRNQIRLDLTRQAFMVSGFNTDFIRATGAGRMAQCWTALHFGDYLAYYLAMAYGVDPITGEELQVFENEVARRAR